MASTLLNWNGRLVKVSKFPLVVLATATVALQPALRSLAYGRYQASNDYERFDSIVVLGTAQYDGRPSRQFAARLRHAAELWKRHGTQQIYTVGGNLPGDRFTEAGVARDHLIKEGVGPERIVAFPHGNDTQSSFVALDSAQLGWTLIVTDPNHSYRAVRIARRHGIQAWPAPTPYSPAGCPSKSFFLTLAHEWGGIVVLDVSALLGQRVADKVEDVLRSLQGWVRPSRRARHEQLRRLKH